LFSKEYSFRYSDRDINGNIKISSVIDLLQDISVSHTDAVGLTVEKLQAIPCAFLLEGWRISLNCNLDPYKKATVKTGIMSFQRCQSLRKYEIWQEGICKIIATAVWFPVDTDKMKIIRAPEETISAYESVNEEDNGLKYMKLRPADDSILSGEMTVEKRDLDTNNHMNNMKSAEAALSFFPDDFEIGELRVRYCKEIKRNDKISFFTKLYENTFFCEMKNENDEVCVLISADRK